MLLTGVEFNEKYKGLNFYKFTNATNKHYGMTYHDGENVDVKELNISDNSTGMYFFETKKAFTHFKEKYTHVRRVTIPDDAKVVVRESSFRTSKFILSPSVELGEDLDLMYEFASTCKTQPNLEFYNALIKFGSNKEQKYEILGRLVKFGVSFTIDTPIEDNEIVNAIENHPYLINVCSHLSLEMYKLALQYDGMLLKSIVAKYDRTVSVARDNYLFINLNEIQSKFNEIATIAITQNFKAIQFVKSPSDELCFIAYSQAIEADKHIQKISKNVAKFAIMKYPELGKLPKYSIGIDEESALELITNNPDNISLIPPDIQTEEMCKLALNANIKNFKHINEKFYYLVTTVF